MLNFIKKAWNAIMNLFKVDGNLSIDTSNVYVNGSKVDLSVCNISEIEYHNLVLEGQCQSNVLYVVSSDSINAYGMQLKNLAAPSSSNDAATKEYVDDQVSKLSAVDIVTRHDVVQIAKEVFKNSLSSILSAI